MLNYKNFAMTEISLSSIRRMKKLYMCFNHKHSRGNLGHEFIPEGHQDSYRTSRDQHEEKNREYDRSNR